MGQFYEEIPDSLFKWILDQKMFWVATAPLLGSGHVNISPKGGPYFGLLDKRTFWYLDLTGSGNETVSHLYEPGNGRITVMFNAFEGGPRILRLFGHGRALENGTPQFADFIKKHDVDPIPGARSIILVDVHQVGSSCGFSVPYYEFKEHRNTLNEFFARKVERYENGKAEDSMPRYFPFGWANCTPSCCWRLIEDHPDTGPTRTRGASTASRATTLPKRSASRSTSPLSRSLSARWRIPSTRP